MVNTRPKTIGAYLGIFFERYQPLRNVLIALGISLLIVAALAATIATLGAAAPVLGVSWGAVIALFGSPLITGMVGSVGVACLTAIGFGLITAVPRFLKNIQPIIPSSPSFLSTTITTTSLSEQQPADATTPLEAGIAASKSGLQIGKLVSKGKKALENPPSPSPSLEVVMNEEVDPKLVNISANISANFDLTTLSRLAVTSKALKNMLEEKFLQAKLEQAAYWIVIKPDDSKVEKIVASNPELLLKKLKEIKDPSGRLIRNVTLFQLAFGSGNYNLCNRLQKHFDRLYHGDLQKSWNEMQQQLQEKFGGGIKMVDEETVLQQFPTLLKDIIQAITDDPILSDQRDQNDKLIVHDRTLQAMNTFHTKFTDLLPQVIDKGMHSCPKIVVELCSQYTNAKYKWKENLDPKVLNGKCVFLEDAVASLVLQYTTAYDAKLYTQGLKKFVPDEIEWLNYSSNTASGKDFYNTLRSASPDFAIMGTGFDIMCGSPRLRGRVSHMGRRKSVDDSANDISLDMYITHRYKALNEFKERLDKKLKSDAVSAGATRQVRQQ